MLTAVLGLIAGIVLVLVAVGITLALGGRQWRRHEAREATRRRLARLTGVQL